MVLPIVAGLAAAGGLGAGLGAIAAGKGSTQTTTYEPYSTYSPSKSVSANIQYPTYQIQIDSPFASQTTKKSQKAEAESTAEPSNSAASGLDLSSLVPVALILGAAYIAGELID